MIIEEYIERLQKIALEHPGARMMATDFGDDYHIGGDYDATPEWSERDQVVKADSWNEEESTS